MVVRRLGFDWNHDCRQENKYMYLNFLSRTYLPGVCYQYSVLPIMSSIKEGQQMPTL